MSTMRHKELLDSQNREKMLKSQQILKYTPSSLLANISEMVPSHSNLRASASGESKQVQGQSTDQLNPIKTQISNDHRKQVL